MLDPAVRNSVRNRRQSPDREILPIGGQLCFRFGRMSPDRATEISLKNTNTHAGKSFWPRIFQEEKREENGGRGNFTV